MDGYRTFFRFGIDNVHTMQKKNSEIKGIEFSYLISVSEHGFLEVDIKSFDG